MIIPSGLSAFPVTPLHDNGEVDTAAYRQLVARLAEAQVDSIGALGSTGTYMFLSRETRRRALEIAIEAAGTVPVVAGIGALRTDDAVRHAQDARAIGARAGLLAPVSYTPLTEDEVFEHFRTVAQESGLPIVIYDNFATTHFRFSPELVQRLAQVPGIVGIKNPSGEKDETLRHLAAQRAGVPSNFSIGYSGDWNATEPLIGGADVWYSVLAGLFPKVCLRITRAAQAGDETPARAVNTALEPLWKVFRAYSSLRVVYTLVEALGICKATPPRPILPLTATQRAEVVAVVAGLADDLKA